MNQEQSDKIQTIVSAYHLFENAWEIINEQLRAKYYIRNLVDFNVWFDNGEPWITIETRTSCGNDWTDYKLSEFFSGGE